MFLFSLYLIRTENIEQHPDTTLIFITCLLFLIFIFLFTDKSEKLRKRERKKKREMNNRSVVISVLECLKTLICCLLSILYSNAYMINNYNNVIYKYINI